MLRRVEEGLNFPLPVRAYTPRVPGPDRCGRHRLGADVIGSVHRSGTDTRNSIRYGSHSRQRTERTEQPTQSRSSRTRTRYRCRHRTPQRGAQSTTGLYIYHAAQRRCICAILSYHHVTISKLQDTIIHCLWYEFMLYCNHGEGQHRQPQSCYLTTRKQSNHPL